MIGAGIFVLTGIAAGAAGPALILSFALNGIITLFTAMTYAELGSAIPEAGGGYLWVKEGLPGPSAFLAGWMSWFAHAVAGSLYALGFGAHVGLVFEELGLQVPGLGADLLQKLLGVAIILIFIYINFRGASETGTAGNIITVLKVLILGLFIGSGIWAIFGNPSYLNKFQDFSPHGLAGVFSAMGLTFIAFEGYEIIVQAGEEVKNPRVNIPRAVFISLAIVIPMYMLVAFVAMGAVNPETGIPTYQWLAQHAELGVAEAARQFMPLGTILLLIGGILSTMSALNATTFSSTRVSFAMGRDRNLPDAFSDIHPVTRTPHKALLWSGVLILAMAIAIPIKDVATAADIMFLLLFLQVNVAVITLRKKYGDRLKYGFIMPFFPYVPIVVIAFKLLLAVFMFTYSPIAWFIALAWIIVGGAAFYVYAKPREDEKSRSPVITQSKLIPTFRPEEYRVVVPIANPASLEGLLAPARNAAQENDGAVTLVHIISVPSQTPLSAGHEYVKMTEPLQAEALELMEGTGVPFEVVVRVAHRVDQAIVETVREKDANLLVMGWRGRSLDVDTTVGRNIDNIIDQVNCKVLVVQQELHRHPDKILIPVDEPQQIRFALEAVEYLTGEFIVSKEVLHIFNPMVAPQERKELMSLYQVQIDEFQRRFPKTAGSISLRSVDHVDPVEGIVNSSPGFDYVIIGATRDGWLKRQFFNSAPSRIAQMIDIPVALTRPRTHALGFGLRMILNYIWGGYRDIDPRSQRELTELGILTGEGDRSGRPATEISRPLVIVSGSVAVAGAMSIYFGDGGMLTWIGALAFIAALFLFTFTTVRAAGT